MGPTASGKTAWGIALARQFGGEVISADSRQIYRGMDIATAKPPGEWTILADGTQAYLIEGIPHHLIDIVNPDTEFTVTDFKRQATELVEKIIARGKIPLIVGGTGLYIRALLDGIDIPSVAPQPELRRSLEALPLIDLVARLHAVDPESAEVIDCKNPRRVLRALEVALITGKSFIHQQTRSESPYQALRIGVSVPLPELFARIATRVERMVGEGLRGETEELLRQGLALTLPSMSGIGYREMNAVLRGEMSELEAIEKITQSTRQYVKRQLTWFKKDTQITWVSEESAMEQLVECFLSQGY